MQVLTITISNANTRVTMMQESEPWFQHGVSIRPRPQTDSIQNQTIHRASGQKPANSPRDLACTILNQIELPPYYMTNIFPTLRKNILNFLIL